MTYNRICVLLFSCLALGATSRLSYAQELSAIHIDNPTVDIDSAVNFQIDFNSLGIANPYCGVEINFGDGESQQIRVGANGARDFPYKGSHSYKNAGNYNVSVSGVFIARGLRSAAPCSGKGISAKIVVKNSALERSIEDAEKKAQELSEKEAQLQQLKAQLESERKKIELREAEIKNQTTADSKRQSTIPTLNIPPSSPASPPRGVIQRSKIDPF